MSGSEHTASDTLGYGDWCDALRDGDLLGQECADCGRTYGTPVSACDDCGSRALDTVDLPTAGEVYTETTVKVPPVGFEGPYQVGLVQVGDARVMARLRGDVDIEDSVALTGVTEYEGDPTPVFAPEA